MITIISFIQIDFSTINTNRRSPIHIFQKWINFVYIKSPFDDQQSIDQVIHILYQSYLIIYINSVH